MKLKNLTAICVILLLSACSKFTEEQHEKNWTDLTVSKISEETLLPIVNIEVDASEFDSIYQYYNDKIEIDARLFLFRNKNEVVSNEEISLEIKGNHTAQFSLKSMEITFDDTYDNSSRNLLNPIKVLPHHSIDKIKAFRLRNSGNDFFRTNLKDFSYSQIAIDAGLDVDIGYGEQAVVFINNAFHGIMEMRTETNGKGVSRLYNTISDNVDLAKVEQKGTNILQSGNTERLQEYISAIDNKNLAYALANTDIPHFIDYLIFQSFVSNSDWPYNNVRFYSINDEPFRFMIYDLDWCNVLYLYKDPEFFIDSEFENIVSKLYKLLMTDETFKLSFEKRSEEILKLPALNPDNFNTRVAFFMRNIEGLIHYQIQKHNAPETLIQWYQEVEILKMNYEKRYRHFK